MAPQRAHCKNCDAILYEGKELMPPSEIVQRYEGRCPACGKKLSAVPRKVEVKPIR